MQRINITERPEWRTLAESLGFGFHTINDEPYWDERAYYAFTLDEIETQIEAPTETIHAMAMDLVDEVVKSEALLAKLRIPRRYWDYIAESWRKRDPHLYGRMDFAYSGQGPAKLLELNYDTPTSIYEAAAFQWIWLEQQIKAGVLPPDADQFNSIQENLTRAFGTMAKERWIGSELHFAAVRDSTEDQGTIAYLRDCAHQAGVTTHLMAIEDLGIDQEGRFTDIDNRIIQTLFKLYPLEMMFEDDTTTALPRGGMQLIEPPWKAILSHKGVLPLLWERHKNHPNLLPAYFEEGNAPLNAGWVRKPFFSREGANIELCLPDGSTQSTDGPYTDNGFIRQAYQAMPEFNGAFPLIGSWVIGDVASGLGVREDASRITQDTSRFMPHAIIG
jgi:glutathionylspermidine synthase